MSRPEPVLAARGELLPWSARYECTRCDWHGEKCHIEKSVHVDKYGIERPEWKGICPDCGMAAVKLVRR